MLDDERIAQNRFKRPLYKVGDTLRVTAEGPYHDWQGEVTSISPLQNIAGYVATYYYRLHMENLGMQQWTEENLTPVIE